jgi:hypothetical protein
MKNRKNNVNPIDALEEEIAETEQHLFELAAVNHSFEDNKDAYKKYHEQLRNLAFLKEKEQ